MMVGNSGQWENTQEGYSAWVGEGWSENTFQDRIEPGS